MPVAGEEGASGWRRGRWRLEIQFHGSMNVDTFEEQFGDKYPTGVWGEFKEEICSNLSDIVVALASFRDESKFFACTGIFIDCDGCSIILTSASLVRDPDGANEIVSNLRIQVLLPNNERTVGELEHYSLQYNVALVSVKNYNVDGRVMKLEPEMILLDESVVAVGRCFESGLLMAASGTYIQDYEEPDDLDCDLWYTTCKTTKAVIGGPLVNLDGEFVGINYYDTVIGTPFMFSFTILKILKGMLDDLKTKKATIGGHKARVRYDDGPPMHLGVACLIQGEYG